MLSRLNEMKCRRCAILPTGGVTNLYTHAQMHIHACTHTCTLRSAVQHILDNRRKTQSPYSGYAIIHNPRLLRLSLLHTPSDTFLIESQIQYRHLFIFIQLTLFPLSVLRFI